MTATTASSGTADEDDPRSGDLFDLRSHHPIRSFVVTLAALAAVVLTCWWVGIFTPRLEVDNGPVGGGADNVFATFEVTNPTPLAVRVISVDLQGHNLHIDRVVDGNQQSTRSFNALRLGPSQRLSVTFIGHPTRCSEDVAFSDGDLQLVAKTALGITRTLRPTIGSYSQGADPSCRQR